MIGDFVSLARRDSDQDCWVFFTPPRFLPPGEQPRVVPARLRSRYESAACRKCGKVNLEQALQLGFDDDITIPAKAPDAFGSNDHARILSARSRDVLEKVAPGAVRYYAFPHTSEYLVALPTRLVYVPEHPVVGSPNPTLPRPPGVDYVVTGKQCTKCGRYRTMTFWARNFQPPPDAEIVGAVVEQGEIPSVHWSATVRVAEAIKKARLSGWWIQRERA